jgi:predicted enzyme related to lactoylglutathione lyase
MGRMLDHVDIRVSDRDASQRFYEAVFSVLGRTEHVDDAAYIDWGDFSPGSRPQYGEDYYGGFLRDPDGNSVEAVYATTSRPSTTTGPVRPESRSAIRDGLAAR